MQEAEGMIYFILTVVILSLTILNITYAVRLTLWSRALRRADAKEAARLHHREPTWLLGVKVYR